MQIVPSSRGSPGHKTKKVQVRSHLCCLEVGRWSTAKLLLSPGNGGMPKMRDVLSLLVAACLCHRRCWRFDEAGEGQSAQVRGTPGVELTGGVSVPPASLLSFSSSLCLWAPSLCSRPLECCTQTGLAAPSAPDPASQAGDLTQKG